MRYSLFGTLLQLYTTCSVSLAPANRCFSRGAMFIFTIFFKRAGFLFEFINYRYIVSSFNKIKIIIY